MKVPIGTWAHLTLDQLIELRGLETATECEADEKLPWYVTAVLFEGTQGVPLAAIASCLKHGIDWSSIERMLVHRFETATGYSMEELEAVPFSELDCEI